MIPALTLETLLPNDKNEVFIRTKQDFEVELIHSAALIDTQITNSGSFTYEFDNGMKIFSDKVLKLTIKGSKG